MERQVPLKTGGLGRGRAAERTEVLPHRAHGGESTGRKAKQVSSKSGEKRMQGAKDTNAKEIKLGFPQDAFFKGGLCCI